MVVGLPDKLLGSQPLCQVIEASIADYDKFHVDRFFLCVYVCRERERKGGSDRRRESKQAPIFQDLLIYTMVFKSI